MFAQLNDCFACPVVDETKFTRVTRAFSDVFSSVHAEQIVAGFNEEAGRELEPPDGKVHMGRDEASYALDDGVFDFELFFAGLSKQMVPRRAVTAKVKEAIKKLAFLYGIPPLEMQKLSSASSIRHTRLTLTPCAGRPGSGMRSSTAAPPRALSNGCSRSLTGRWNTSSHAQKRRR